MSNKHKCDKVLLMLEVDPDLKQVCRVRWETPVDRALAMVEAAREVGLFASAVASSVDKTGMHVALVGYIGTDGLNPFYDATNTILRQQASGVIIMSPPETDSYLLQSIR